MSDLPSAGDEYDIGGVRYVVTHVEPTAEQQASTAMAIVRDLAANDPTFSDHDDLDCNACPSDWVRPIFVPEPETHAPTCPYRRAVELVAQQAGR